MWKVIYLGREAAQARKIIETDNGTAAMAQARALEAAGHLVLEICEGDTVVMDRLKVVALLGAPVPA